MAERESGHARDPFDWYIEPETCVHALFNVVAFDGTIHDPCCGRGTIPGVARHRGYSATGSDIVDRADGQFPVVNFLHDDTVRDAICTNPPFKDSVAIIEHAQRIVRPGGVIAILAQSKFLFSQRRIDLFDNCYKIVILSKRPSMPPGAALAEHGESIRGGGSMDYCWCIWLAGVTGSTSCSIDWTL